jgi:hypothetical protein
MSPDTANSQTLAEWCAWLRNDLAFRAPELWPDAIERWLRDTEERFGHCVEREAER